jgi:hypothetical protein
MIQTHVSELAIDRMLAGELSAVEARAVGDHARTCARCGTLYDEAKAARADFARVCPPLRLPGSRPRLAIPIGAVATLAAALAVVIAWPRTRAEPTVRAKGSAIVGFFVAHGNQVRRGSVRETVVPGDRIELVTTTTSAAWFAAVSDDAAGTRSVYVALQPIVAGREQLQPMSIELDGVLGSELVSAVFCTGPFDPVSIDLRTPPAGCTVDRFTLVKVPR